MRLTANKRAKREKSDLQALGNFETIYKTQQESISRRLFGAKDKAEKRVVTYLTLPELEAVKSLAEAIGMNTSCLIRLTLVTLAAAGLPADYTTDPRLG
jgi:predicted DNA binding CopG/RHH family protein